MTGPKGRVISVDDNPTNLKLLEDILLGQGYQVSSFPRGRLALAAAEQECPELFLLDVNMPEMNGYEVCEKLKASPRLAAIPVIFISALDALEDKVHGFRAGGVDYISKPFQFEEVLARVATHVRLHRVHLIERDLLEGTLNGAIGTIWELVHLTSPLLAQRSRNIREMVQWITKDMHRQEGWQYDLAGMLSLVGCLALPSSVFERAYAREKLTQEEEETFLSHAETGGRLLARIPRLEVVAQIVQRQYEWKDVPTGLDHVCVQGVRIIGFSQELDRRMFAGQPFSVALARCSAHSRFETVTQALRTFRPSETEERTFRLTIRELRFGMVVAADIWTQDGAILIFKAGTTLTETWIERLANFARTAGVQEPITVRLPKNVRDCERFA